MCALIISPTPFMLSLNWCQLQSACGRLNATVQLVLSAVRVLTHWVLRSTPNSLTICRVFVSVRHFSVDNSSGRDHRRLSNGGLQA
jgi:hypothetical protein